MDTHKLSLNRDTREEGFYISEWWVYDGPPIKLHNTAYYIIIHCNTVWLKRLYSILHDTTL